MWLLAECHTSPKFEKAAGLQGDVRVWGRQGEGGVKKRGGEVETLKIAK